MAAHDPLYVLSLAKAFRLLEAFSQHAGAHGLTLKELAEMAQLDRSAAQRMAHTLVQLGYLERSDNRSYVLGKKLLERTFDFLRTHPLVARATPVLVDLQKESGERVDLSLFDDLSIIYALRRQTKRQTFFATLVGRRMPTYASSGGRAILSHLDAAQVDDILARSDLKPVTAKTITDPAAILAQVDLARKQGYALAIEETLMGEVVLASAVLGQNGVPVGAVHISGSCAEWAPEDFVRRFAPLAIEAARALYGGA